MIKVKCVLCGKTAIHETTDQLDNLGWVLYWCYSHVKGREVSYDVCKDCDIPGADVWPRIHAIHAQAEAKRKGE